MVREGDYTYPLPWHRVDAPTAFVTQLRREVGEGHRLTEPGVVSVARCQACDDVLFRLADGTYARVHLGYPREPELDPRWPSRRYFETFDDAVAYVEAHDPYFDA
jgi:hypothetical protein